jgi:hypothetical protein
MVRSHASVRKFKSSFIPNGRVVTIARMTDETDWDEIRELVTDSYRILAPKKLTALLD